MEVGLTSKALEDVNYWSKTGNKAILKKIDQLIESIKISPFTGIGKPEALKHHLSSYWSRRISSEHRIVYQVTDEMIYIYSLKGHYI